MNVLETRIKWTNDVEMARLLRLSPGCLRNWRVADSREGRGWLQPGRGGLRWRRFGRSVRYLLTEELAGGVGVDHGDADRG